MSKMVRARVCSNCGDLITPSGCWCSPDEPAGPDFNWARWQAPEKIWEQIQMARECYWNGVLQDTLDKSDTMWQIIARGLLLALFDHQEFDIELNEMEMVMAKRAIMLFKFMREHNLAERLEERVHYSAHIKWIRDNIGDDDIPF